MSKAFCTGLVSVVLPTYFESMPPVSPGGSATKTESELDLVVPAVFPPISRSATGRGYDGRLPASSDARCRFCPGGEGDNSDKDSFDIFVFS